MLMFVLKIIKNYISNEIPGTNRLKHLDSLLMANQLPFLKKKLEEYLISVK